LIAKVPEQGSDRQVYCIPPDDNDPIAIRNVRALRRWRAKPQIARFSCQHAFEGLQ